METHDLILLPIIKVSTVDADSDRLLLAQYRLVYKFRFYESYSNFAFLSLYNMSTLSSLGHDTGTESTTRITVSFIPTQ